MFNFPTSALLGAACALSIVAVPAAGAVVTVDTEANIRSGSSRADTNLDEVADNRLIIKHKANVSSSGSAYFRFDLTGQNADLTQPAFVDFTLNNPFNHTVSVWALDQAYDDFSADITWNNAKFNDTSSNDLLTTGEFTATKFVDSLPVSDDNGFTVELASLAPFVFNDRIIIALTGAEDGFVQGDPNEFNQEEGLRIAPGTAALRFSEVPEPASLAMLALGGLMLQGRRRR